MEHALLFNEPKFATYDLQSTCRLGQKWFGRLSPGDEVLLADGEGNRVGTAEIVGVSICPYSDIPVGWASKHHLPRVATTFDLADQMSQIYDGFDSSKPCTMILFRPDLDSRTN